MQDQILKQYFTVIKQDFNRVEERFQQIDERFQQVDERFQQVDERFDRLELKMDQGFKRQDDILSTILNIVKVYDIERKEMKATLWEFDRRLIKLEKNSA